MIHWPGAESKCAGVLQDPGTSCTVSEHVSKVFEGGPDKLLSGFLDALIPERRSSMLDIVGLPQAGNCRVRPRNPLELR